MTPVDFKKLFALAPGRYPALLEKGYPRVFKKILENWDTPKEQQAYFNDLVVDVRGDRQGFPPEVMAELLFVSAIYHRWLNDRRRRADPQRLKELSPSLVHDLEKKQAALTPEMTRALAKIRGLLMRDDLSVMDFMLAQNVEPNQRDVDGMTPLMHASCANAEKCVLALIKINANPHMTDDSGNTALHWAVVMNRLRIAEILLYFGANPDHKNKAGATALALAAIKTDTALAARLLDYNAGLLEMDALGNTPLHKAVMSRSASGALLLLHAGSNKDIKNKSGVTPQDLADKVPEMAAVFAKYRAEIMRGLAK